MTGCAGRRASMTPGARGPPRRRGRVGDARRAPGAGVRRPRVRATDGSGELPVPAYDLFSSTEMLGEMAMAKMMAKLSTRRYRAGLEPVGTQVEEAARTWKSAVSRRFVDATETALAELMTCPALDIVALMVDGVHFADHLS